MKPHEMKPLTKEVPVYDARPWLMEDQTDRDLSEGRGCQAIVWMILWILGGLIAFGIGVWIYASRYLG